MPALGLLPEHWARFNASLSASGFDLVQPCCVGWYNEAAQGDLRLEDWGSPDHLAIVVGNTRTLWPRFIAALRAEPALLADAHPLERYTERSVSSAAALLPAPASVRWAHDSGARVVAMQRLAHVSGLAYLAPSHLSVHPVFGPWIALRAVLSLPRAGPAHARVALQHPCVSCSGRCLPAFERAMAASAAPPPGAATTRASPPSAAAVEADWRLWLACRDACPTGRAFRYSDPQIEYHYRKDRSLLKLCIADSGA